MAIKVHKEIDEIVALISNIFETFTTAFYEFYPESNELDLFSFYSLSQNIKKDFNLNLGKNLSVWLKEFKKPITIKENLSSDYLSLLKIYKKKEEVKCFYAVPVGNQKGLLYIDTKRTYAFPEKEQKLLYHCAEIIDLLLKIRDSAMAIKEVIDYTEMAKMIKLKILGSKNENLNISSMLNILSDYLHFDFGCLIINEFKDKFKIIGTNFPYIDDIVNRNLSLKNTVIGSYIFKKVKLPKFVEIKDENFNENFFSKFERLSKDSVKNFLYFPFESSGKIIGAFIFFNFKKRYNFKKLCYYLYDVLYPFVFRNSVKDHIYFIAQREPVSGFLRDYYFFKLIKESSFEDFKVIFLRNLKLKIFFKKYPLNFILKSYKKIKIDIEKIFNVDVEGVLISLDRMIFLLSNISNRDFSMKKNIIQNSLSNRLLKVDNVELSIQFEIECFNSLIDDKNEILKKCF